MEKKIPPISMCILFLMACVILWNPACYAKTLTLPESAKTIIQQIKTQCQSCLEKGFSPTGTGNIGFGKKFFPNFFTGTPQTGLLVSHIIKGVNFIDIIRNNQFKTAHNKLMEAFKNTRILIVEKKNLKVHLSETPLEVQLILKESLHQCLYQTEKPLCCCCTENCDMECCEKKLGSTFVYAKFSHPLFPQQYIEYRYYPLLGSSTLKEVDPSGKEKSLRWCIDSQGPGFLKVQKK